MHLTNPLKKFKNEPIFIIYIQTNNFICFTAKYFYE